MRRKKQDPTDITSKAAAFYPAATTSSSSDFAFLPSQSTIDAFTGIRKLYESHDMEWSNLKLRTPHSVQNMQQYLLAPSVETWSSVLDHVRYHRARGLTPCDQARTNDRKPMEETEQCHHFEQFNRKLSEEEKLRLGALIRIAAIIGGSLPDWSKELLLADVTEDKSTNSNCRWGQPFFLDGSCEILLKKIYRGSSPIILAIHFPDQLTTRFLSHQSGVFSTDYSVYHRCMPSQIFRQVLSRRFGSVSSRPVARKYTCHKN